MQQTHHKPFRFLSYALLAIMTLSIPLALVVSHQAQKLQQHAQTNVTTIAIETAGFSPKQITIPAGTTVRWINSDTVNQHTTTSDTQGSMDSWDSRGLGANQAFSQTFMTPGTYHYHCTLHAGMRGTIIVTASLATNTPTPPGTQPTATTTPAPSPTPVGYPSPTTYCLGSCPTPTPIPASPSPTNAAQTPTITPSGGIISTTPTEEPSASPTPQLSGTETPTEPTPPAHGDGSNDLLSLLLKFILTFLGLLLSLFKL